MNPLFTPWFFVVLIGVASERIIRAQPGESERIWSYSSNVGEAHPLSSLPSQVAAPEGELTLFADCSDIVGDRVGLYLVNRTKHCIGFSSQDGDVYVKLEGLTEEGAWERAQIHRGSWCGNSYFRFPILRPNEYFRFGGYFPSTGETRPVRYRIYSDRALILNDNTDEDHVFLKKSDFEKLPLSLVSDVAQGKVRPHDIDAARRDSFAIPYGNFATVRDIALGVVLPDRTGGLEGGLERSQAVQSLGRFPTEESLTLLKEFLSDPDRNIPGAAMRGIAKMGLEFEPAEKLYQELLGSHDAQLRVLAIMALTERPITPAVIQFAKEQLSHDDLYVRVMAMGVISHLCKTDPEVNAFLNAAYDDPDPKIRSVFEMVLFPGCVKDKDGRNRGRRTPGQP